LPTIAISLKLASTICVMKSPSHAAWRIAAGASSGDLAPFTDKLALTKPTLLP